MFPYINTQHCDMLIFRTNLYSFAPHHYSKPHKY